MKRAIIISCLLLGIMLNKYDTAVFAEEEESTVTVTILPNPNDTTLEGDTSKKSITNNKKLPQTNEVSNSSATIIGISLLVGVGVHIKKQKREEESINEKN
ncbi:hypothetical protein QuyetLC_24590 [Bacillus anthracis]|uniref:Gram-positive cocci surface proteins LPxTG domain-containing protein n=1 Tax=Bacillus anthracis TaxID=1392 RepID=A0A640MHE7_BACAN|nr:hypothetical protein QuyetLC_24590 [Bacillus anthracis]